MPPLAWVALTIPAGSSGDARFPASLGSLTAPASAGSAWNPSVRME